MVTSPYKWKILEQNVKQWMINLYRRIRSEKDRRTIQQDLDTLQKWEVQWLMQLLPGKCKVLQTTARTPLQSKYTIHGQALNNVNSAKYLGLNIHKTHCWDVHINKVTQKAHNFSSFSSRNISRCPTNIKAQCFKPNAFLHLWDHIWNTHLQIGAQLRIKASARLRQSKVELFVSPLVITDKPAVLWRWWNN
jgi:hypothetical protein